LKIKLLFSSLFFVCCASVTNNISFAQCSGGTPFGTINPINTWQTVGGLFAGQYLSFNATAGNNYQFSLCSANGGAASYNSEITILDNSGNYAGGYNDDSCGQQSFLAWNPSTSGTYRVLINEVSCQPNTTNTTLAYKTTAPSGQCYSVNQISYLPENNTGTPVLVNLDDIWSGVIQLGFNFCFYGITYNQCIIGSNEVISFDIGNANTNNTWPISAAIPSPSPTDLLNSIMAPWQDVDPGVAGNITYNTNGIAPNRKFIVTFDNIAMFSCNTLFSTSQIILYETSNIIETHILNKDVCSTWNAGAAIHGIQDQTGSNAEVVPGRNYPTLWTATNDGYRFTPTCPPCGNPISVGENIQSTGIVISPNPTSGKIEVRSERSEVRSIEIYNIYGEKVYSAANFQINSSSNFQIDLSEANNGVYFVKVQTNEGITVRKIVIQK
jgi:hypothetical protein